MKLRAPQIALGTLPLLVGALAVVPGALTAAAGAACAPGTAVAAKHAHASAKVRVARGAPVVTKRHRHTYVARVPLVVTQGAASVKLVVSVCPDGAAGSAATTTQTAAGKGVKHRTAQGTGRSAAAARKDARRAAARVTVALKRAGASGKARHRAEKRAVARAKAAAVQKAHDALYLSDVVYAVTGADGVFHLTSTAPGGGVSLAGAPGGDLLLTVPAGYQPRSGTAWPCIRRAPVWPTSFVFDGGDVTAPALQQAASVPAERATMYGIDAWPTPDPSGANALTGQNEQSWFGGWHSTTAAYSADVAPNTPVAAPLVCFEPSYPVTTGAYTALLHSAHVGTAAASIDGQLKVPGGVPVTLR